jgi:hypothetical protein
VDDSGTVSIAKDAWWIAVIAVPLTAVTLLSWQYWLYSSNNKRHKEQEAKPNFEKNIASNSLWSKIKMSENLRWFGGRFVATRNRQRNQMEV